MAREAEPMSDERLAEIRHVSDRYNGDAGSYSGNSSHPTRDAAMLGHAMPLMLAEVERLRAREAALTGECIAGADDQNKLRAELLEALRIVRAVATADNSDNSVCYQVCDYAMHGDWMIEHEAPCVVKQARALLASE